MIALWIVLILVLILLILLGVAAARAIQMKPTSAATAQFPDSDLERAQRYAETLSTLVQCETVSEKDQVSRRKFQAFHKLLREQFPLVHKAATRTVLNGSLIYKIPGLDGGAGAPILIMSHHDVVPAQGEWKYPPFSGEIAEGSVWGRGTVDTKGSLFCFMQAVEELLAEGWKPECDVYLASSCTEEWGGDGAPAIAAWLKEQGVHLGLLLDEGGMIMDSPMAGVKGRYAMVGVVEKGYADVKFTANAAGGHASAPGPNTALVQLARFICKTDRHSPFQARFSPTLREMFQRLAPNMSFGMRMLLGNLWLFEPLLCFLLPRVNPLAGAMMRTTCAFTMAEGSPAYNVLPQQAWVTANMRCMPHQGTDESIEIIRAAAKKCGLDTEVLKADPACAEVDFKGDAFRLLEETMGKIYPGYGVAPYIMTGGTDARFYMYEGVVENALRFAPLEINKQQYASIHAANENLSILALPPAVDFYQELLRSYCARNGKPELAPEKPARKAPARKKAAPKAKTEAEEPVTETAQPEDQQPAPEAPAEQPKKAAKPKKSTASKAEAAEAAEESVEPAPEAPAEPAAETDEPREE
ncbi:M20/M25/M40 family metallo-hydrolase [Fournierella sp.]|uniref:M20/M25/M40 family metallo-hydrolase n=1 Tax=Allofournierella sp. TaxID=1940256 RepID=UPI00307A7090